MAAVSGFKALAILNAFLSSHEYALLVTDASPGETHYSLARGNEGVSPDHLTTEQAFGGEIHGKLRSLVGMIGGLVDRPMLPAYVLECWDALDKKQAEYLKHIRVLSTFIDQENKRLGVKELVYVDRDSLIGCVRKIDPALADQETAALKTLADACEPLTVCFHEALDHCANIPLRLKTSPEEQKPETFLTVEIANSRSMNLSGFHTSLLRSLVSDKMAKYGQMSDIKRSYQISSIGTTGRIIEGVESKFFETLGHTPQAAEFMKALDEKLLTDIKQYLDRLDTRYGAELATSCPDIYQSFSLVRQRLGLSAGCALGVAKIETPSQVILEPVLARTADKQTTIHKAPLTKCPFGYQ